MNSILNKMPANSHNETLKNLLTEFSPDSFPIKVYNYIQGKKDTKQLKAFILRELDLQDYVEVDNSQAVPPECWERKVAYWRKFANKEKLNLSRSVRHCDNDSDFCITLILSRRRSITEA